MHNINYMKKLLLYAIVGGLFLPISVFAAGSYANKGGVGDRTSFVKVTSNLTVGAGSLSELVDGNVSANLTGFYFTSQTTSGKYLLFDFGSPAVVDGFTYFQSNTSSDNGLWSWVGSLDGLSTTSICTNVGQHWGPSSSNATVMIDNNCLVGNTTSYRYYEMVPTTGTDMVSGSPYANEFEFSISGLDATSTATTTVATSTTQTIDNPTQDLFMGFVVFGFMLFFVVWFFRKH